MQPKKSRIQRDPRYGIRDSRRAVVEFPYPNANGRRLRWPLHEVSISGFSFTMDHELPLVVRGAKLPEVTVRFGDCEIRGSLVVKHVTEQDESHFICGALFYPATEIDMYKLNGVLAGISTELD